ncbi:MAG: helicase-related protein [Thermoplasmata archaeon]|nr:helicase-related protein [Thermoplasmata archaeon]
MLVQQLDGKTLVIAPPFLISEDNPGSWPIVFRDFGVRSSRFESLGKLDKLLLQGIEKYDNVIIDEAHRFRTESTQMYEKLFEICRGKRVILVSATPLNNTPLDILSQIKLFQNAHRSTLPNPRVKDLDKYFKALQAKLKGLDRQVDKDEYLQIIQDNAKDIRENVLKYLMVRRTRGDITANYTKDLKDEKLKFPEVMTPEIVVYNFDEDLDKIFNKTLELIIKEFKYSRYTPLLYLKEEIPENEKTPQRNMSRFMKILLVKRLESSFYAFKQSIERFIYSHQRFIEVFKKGNVYIARKNINKIFELLENDDTDAIQKMIESDEAEKRLADEFKPEFIKDLEHDLRLLLKIQDMWGRVNQDPKLDKFIEILTDDKILKKHKLLVFTESKDTAMYLEEKLNPKFDKKVLAFSSHSGEATRHRIIRNYDANTKKDKQLDDIKILVSTDILSEGVSLHRSNVVINYDIPWNPVRMMQRVGRVNRVSKDPPFDKIYTYNFFPAGPINQNIGLREAAESKIKAFIEMLGNDAVLLTDEEIKTHDLFMKLNSKEILTGEEGDLDQELIYLTYLRGIRDKDQELYEKIKRLPKKARTARDCDIDSTSVITFFRKGKLRKIFMTSDENVDEVDFFTAAETLKTPKNTKRAKLETDFYTHLEANKKAFNAIFEEDAAAPKAVGTSYESKLIKRIKAIIKKPELTDEDEEYLQKVLDLLRDGGIPKATMKKIEIATKDDINPLKIFAKIKAGISPNLFKGTVSGSTGNIVGLKEVVLSEYLKKVG